MEDTLGGYYSRVNQSVDCDVLILVLMEDTLGDVIESLIKAGAKVLILVLMEDTLGVEHDTIINHIVNGLNPCFNGRYSRRVSLIILKNLSVSLNPCFNGRYSRSS